MWIRRDDREQLCPTTGRIFDAPANLATATSVNTSLLYRPKQDQPMRTVLLSLALAIGVSASAQSTDHQKTGAEKAKHLTERMTKELGLDATQQEKVASINLAYAREMETVKALPVEADRDGRSQELKHRRDKAYQSVLSEEQYTKLVALNKEREAKKEGQEANEEQ